MKNFRWDKKYLYWGVTAFLVVVFSILFYHLVSHLPAIRSGLSAFVTILSPFVWGLVIAYLLCPLMNILQKSVFQPLGKRIYKSKPEKAAKFGRAFAVMFSIIFLLIVLVAMIWLIAPRLYFSLETIVLNSSEYVKKAYAWFDRTLVNYPEIEETITSTFGNVSEGIFGWIQSSILPRINNIITNVTSGVYYFLKGVYNVIIGIIVSVYLLYNKETFGAYVKKIIYCIFSVEAAEKILTSIDFVDDVFIGFLSGKILDSTIIGIICYIVCLILRMPYALLVSFIVGITNIIPFFGPFIGAVPSTLIILMEDPIKGLIFVVFIIVLQQFDGNFLGPKILGNSVGINGFWVMFSIILGAGLFGFMGMLLGVPVFVVIFTAIKALVNRKLKRSGLSTETEYYSTIRYIDPVSGKGVEKEDKTHRKNEKKPKNTGSGETAPGVDSDNKGINS